MSPPSLWAVANRPRGHTADTGRIGAALIMGALLAHTAHAQPAAQQTCVDVEVGSAQSYDCLNQKLQAATSQSPRFSSDSSAPYAATSPSNVTGQFNESATRNRLGANFGKSVTPQRPAQVFAPPPR